MANRIDRTNRAPRALATLAFAALLAPGAAHAAAAEPTMTLSSPAAIAFWAMGLLTVGSGALVAFSRNILYSAFGLLGAFLGVAGLYVFMSADFLAVTQLLIYVGGVLVLILFAVFLTGHIGEVKVSNQAMGVAPAALATVATTVLLLAVALFTHWHQAHVAPSLQPTAAKLGDLFLNRYLLPFEIASVVLLVTLIGAVVVARKEIKPE